MTIDDTNVAASRGEVRIDTDGTLWTRATAAWKQYPQTIYAKIISPPLSIGGPNAQAAVRGQVYLTAFQIPQRMTINYVEFTPSVGSGTIRVAIYSDNGSTPVGGAKLFDTGNIGYTAAATPTFAYTINPGLYYIAVTFSTSTAQFFRGSSSSSWLKSGTIAASTFSYASDFTGIGGPASYTKSTALPSTCPSISNSAVASMIWFANVT